MAGTTQFVGVRELGIIAGSGILLCVVSAIVVLPPLIFVFDRERPPGNTPTLLPVALWLSWLHARPGLVLSLAVIATAASLVGVTRLKYDHNLLHLQPSHVEVQLPRYRRVFALSKELDPAKISAELKNGVLKLRIPRAEHLQPRRIDVKVA